MQVILHRKFIIKSIENNCKQWWMARFKSVVSEKLAYNKQYKDGRSARIKKSRCFPLQKAASCNDL